VKESHSAKKVLLVGWDAADWRFINPLLDAGLMPNLNRLVEEGVMGSLSTLSPCLSPILWTSIATGKTADKHGITGFVEPVPGGGGIRLSTSTSRTTKALWNILSQSGLKSLVVGWFASHPAEPIDGMSVSNRFFEGLPEIPSDPWEVIPGSLHPEKLAPILSGLRMHPAEFVHDDLTRLIPEIKQIDLDKDDRPVKLCESLAHTVAVHSVITGAMQAEPWDFAAVYFNALDVCAHLFMQFHPPQLPGISDDDFRLYQHVMRELYLFHDGMLGRLLELAGEETTVILVSDHGFHSDHLRPGDTHGTELTENEALAWHRKYGVIAMRGPGIQKDERIYGANLLDITPTILTLFGLPIGQDMDGRPLIQAFVDPPDELHTIPTWDLPADNDGMHPAGLQQAMMDSTEAIEQLVALGYLPAESVDSAKAVEVTVSGSQYNLSIVHSSHGRIDKAIAILEELHRKTPDNPRYALSLAKIYGSQNQHQKSVGIVKLLESKGYRTVDGDLLVAAAMFDDGRHPQALQLLAESEQLHPPSTALFNLVGKLHQSVGAWQLAAEAFGKSVQLDEEDAHAHNGLAQTLLKMGDWEPAAEHALRAVALLFFYPQAHFHMGMAFKGMGETNRALRSLNLAVTQMPGFVDAHQELANIYEQIHEVPLWLNHQRMASGLPPLQ